MNKQKYSHIYKQYKQNILMIMLPRKKIQLLSRSLYYSATDIT